MKDRNPYRKRIQVAVDILGELIGRNDVDRYKFIELMKYKYSKAKIQPIRGKALPPDIYDKELATLYVIGKYGLGIDIDYSEIFNRIFDKEILLDQAIEDVLKGEYEKARKVLVELSSARIIDSNIVARMLRVGFTKTILGFTSEDVFFELLRKCEEAFPEERRTVHNFARFYIAFKLAEEIYSGNIRDRITKEAYKQALAMKMGFSKIMPSDKYIYTIASDVFNINKHVLEKILNLKR